MIQKNCLVFTSYYGHLQLFMYQNDCLLIKKGQRLQMLYRLNDLKNSSKKEQKKKVQLTSLFTFLQQFLFRLTYPSLSSLSLMGMAFRARLVIKDLDLSLGHSHKIIVPCPNAIKILIRKSQRQHTIYFFSSTLFDSNNVASKIIKYRPVSPYTGKGLIWSGNKILRKEGKGQYKR
jgi:large subunit ribosomal protein L6